MGMKSSVVKSLGGSAPTLIWKNNLPGSLFVDGDEVDAEHNSIVMVRVEQPDEQVDIFLPDITPESAGRQIHIRNQVSLDGKVMPGIVMLFAGDNDTIEGVSPLDTEVFPITPDFDGLNMGWHFLVESDGVSRWSFIYPLGGLQYLSPA